MIKKSKSEYYQKSVVRLKDQGAGVIPYKILKDIAIPDRPKSWSINSLKPKMSDKELAKDLASFFIKITDEFVPLNTSTVPVTFLSPFPPVLPHQVAERIRSGKKAKTAVEGDILP